MFSCALLFVYQHQLYSYMPEIIAVANLLMKAPVVTLLGNDIVNKLVKKGLTL
jgi:hypothetical protein